MSKSHRYVALHCSRRKLQVQRALIRNSPACASTAGLLCERQLIVDFMVSRSPAVEAHAVLSVLILNNTFSYNGVAN